MELDALDAQLERSKAAPTSETDFEEADDEVSKLEAASEIMRNAGILLEYIANPDFCKSLTTRERKNAEKQAERLFAAAEGIEEIAEQFEDDEEDEEDAEGADL